MYLLTSVRLIDFTMEFGLNEFSATAFTYLAILARVVLNDFEAMEPFQNIGLWLLQKFRACIYSAETIFVGHQLGLL